MNEEGSQIAVIKSQPVGMAYGHTLVNCDLRSVICDLKLVICDL